MTNDSDEKKLRELVLGIVEQDKLLREKFHIGDKFRFIRDRLLAMQQKVEEELKEIEIKKKDRVSDVTADEIIVYVYLFNAQGNSIPTWQKFLQPSVFYEYSVNRPVYSDRSAIDSLVRTKVNRTQHGYLAVAIKKSDLINKPATEDTVETVAKAVKIREGSLRFNRLLFFRHNETDYLVNEDGTMEVKPTQP